MSLLKIEDIKKLNDFELNIFLKQKLPDIKNYIDIITDQEQPVVAGTKSPNYVCIFVDNSNFIAQGEYSICYKRPLNDLLYYNQIIFDYEGYDVNVFGRNCASREKGVDNFITLKIAKMIYTESPGILVLIARDSDYYGTLLEAIDYNWKVEFWKLGILNSLNKHEPTDLCTKHLSL
ncbi:NYN domain-containing protein [Rhizophagus irregularis DAOM 181602=DAOM 197198]|nr:NYN domain-containing protein [Rhizophagus irregularis DAOM 181602=DAOM 197198]